MRKISILRIPFILILAFALVGVIAAPSLAQVRDTFGDWDVVCDLEKCTMIQGLRNPARPSISYSSEISFVESKDEPVLQLNLPLGIYLPPGVGLEIGSTRRDIPVAVCLPQGCHAIVSLDDALMGGLSSQPAYQVRFYTNESTPNEVKFSLNGFKDAYQALVERRR